MGQKHDLASHHDQSNHDQYSNNTKALRYSNAESPPEITVFCIIK